jgi:hypothetical protein
VQDKYVGDIGDYFKYGLLRRLMKGKSLGVFWYLFPDEKEKWDGGHIDYLDDPEKWRSLDPKLFDTLGDLVKNHHRNVASVAQSGLFGDALFAGERLIPPKIPSGEPKIKNSDWRTRWFNSASSYLKTCDLVFADPDNGLCEDDKYEYGQKAFWKRIPLWEVHAISEKRTAIIYHHNTHKKGGHEKEIRDWCRTLGKKTIALRWRAQGSRTFFIINPNRDTLSAAKQFCKDWGDDAEFYGNISH